MRDKSVLRKLMGLCVSTVVVVGRELVEVHDGGRGRLDVWVRTKVGLKGRCGKCGVVSPWFDNGGGERRWRHVDVCFATCELVAEAPRVSCPEHGVTVAQVPWARHDSWFTRAFEDLVVFDAIVSSKLAASRRYGVSWRAVDHMCVRVATEALGRIDLLDGLVAIAIDEVKYKKGQRYLLVTWNQAAGLNKPSVSHELRGQMRLVDSSGGEVASARPTRASGGVVGDLGGPWTGAKDDRCLCEGAG